MSTTVVKTITLRTDDMLVDENNQEIPVDTIVHCLGALFIPNATYINFALVSQPFIIQL